MEEINLEEAKDPGSSIYVTAVIPELYPQISQGSLLEQSFIGDFQSKDEFTENSRIYENPDFDVKEDNKVEEYEYYNEETEYKEEKNKEHQSTEKKWQDVNLIDTEKELKYSNSLIVFEEPIKELISIQDSHKGDNKVSINNVKLIQAGFLGVNSYYIYEIYSEFLNKKYKVNRRFKDFEWLHHSLKQDYKGMSIPPLPPKTNPLLQDRKTRENRRVQLEKSLEILLKHSSLKDSKALFIFLTCEDSEFSKIKENIKLNPNFFKYNNFEDALDQVISIIQAKMNQIFSLRILPFSKELLAIDRYLAQIRIPTYTLMTAFDMTISSQRKSNSILQSMRFAHSDFFYKASQMHKYLVSDSDSELKNLNNHLQEENLKIEALKSAIDDYKAALKKYSELEVLVERKFAKARNNTDEVERYLTEIKNIKNDIFAIENEILKIENNIKNEKIWFQAERDEYLEWLLGKVCQLQRNRLIQEENFWLEKKHEIE